MSEVRNRSPAFKGRRKPDFQASPYPHLPIYCALMLCSSGGFDLEDKTPSGLERQIRQYLREYDGDDDWNWAVLHAVHARQFRDYVPGKVRAVWPNENELVR